MSGKNSKSSRSYRGFGPDDPSSFRRFASTRIAMQVVGIRGGHKIGHNQKAGFCPSIPGFRRREQRQRDL